MFLKNVLGAVLSESHGVFVQPRKNVLLQPKPSEVGQPKPRLPLSQRKDLTFKERLCQRENFLRAHDSSSTRWLILAWYNHRTSMPGVAAIPYLWHLPACSFHVLLPIAKGDGFLGSSRVEIIEIIFSSWKTRLQLLCLPHLLHTQVLVAHLRGPAWCTTVGTGIFVAWGRPAGVCWDQKRVTDTSQGFLGVRSIRRTTPLITVTNKTRSSSSLLLSAALSVLSTGDLPVRFRLRFRKQAKTSKSRVVLLWIWAQKNYSPDLASLSYMCHTKFTETYRKFWAPQQW